MNTNAFQRPTRLIQGVRRCVLKGGHESGAIYSAISFSILAGTPSETVVLYGFRFLRSDLVRVDLEKNIAH